MNAATAQDESEDRYYTQVDAGDVRLFTLDQLDAAFNAGLIHENTYVCLEGSSEWLTLAEVAGLNDEEPVSAPQPIVQPAAPIAQPAPHYAAFAPPSAPAPRVVQAPTAAMPSVVVTPSAVSAPYSLAPSIRPVTSDLSLDDDDLDMMSMRPKRRIGKFLVAAAVLALGGVGFATVQSGGVRLSKLNLGESAGQTAAASLTLSDSKEARTTTQPATPAPASVAEPPKAEEAKPSDSPATNSAAGDPADGATAKKSDDRFTEEMKAALLNKDKKQATDTKHKKAARGAIAAKHTAAKAAKGSGGGFKSGGSAYDPLNGKL